jgi:hypothetical protein
MLWLRNPLRLLQPATKSVLKDLSDQLEVISSARLFPYLLIPFTLWLVGIVEAIQKIGGQKLDPRFWMFLSIIITIYTGVRIFRLSPLRRKNGGERARAPSKQILDCVHSSGLELYYEVDEGRRGIDYVVVGAAGIYAIEVKARDAFGSRRIDYRDANELVLGGKISDNQPLKEARSAAQKVRERLAGHLPTQNVVKPMVVFLGDWQIDQPETEADVAVVSAGDLEQYLKQQRPVLSSAELAEISTYLENLSLAGG